MQQQTFIVVATFTDDADMAAVAATVPEEIRQVEALRGQGRMGGVHVAFARRTVFIEVLAADEAAAIQTVQELPLARWFILDVYPTSAQGLPAAA